MTEAAKLRAPAQPSSNGEQIKQATKDQSLVQQLVDVGQISEAEAETHMFRNVILQALGAQSELTPVTGKIRIRRGDILLMCSDGLSGKLRAEDMRRIIEEGIRPRGQDFRGERRRRG